MAWILPRLSLAAATAVLAALAPAAVAAAAQPPAGASSAAILRQADGRIVSVTSGFGVSRDNPDGSPDPTFGEDGRVETDFGGGGLATARSLAIDDEGRIVLAGTYVRGGPDRASRQDDLALARYLPDGSLDPSFGQGGTSVVDLASGSIEFVHDVVVAPGGRILVAAAAFRWELGTDFAVAAFRPDGALDASFGHGGVALARPPAAQAGEVGALALQPDGKVVVAGSAIGMPFTHLIAVLRLTAGGEIDSGFGDGGFVTADPVTSSWGQIDVSDVFLDPAGDLVVAATERTEEHCCTNAVLLRLGPDGVPDPGFGGGEPGVAKVLQTGLVTAAPLADGTIFVGGAAHRGLVVARLDAGGSALPFYGRAGAAVVRIGGLTTEPTAYFAEPDGRALALATVRAAHCRVQSRRWVRCRPEATLAYTADGGLDRRLGGLGFVTRPRMHLCRDHPLRACGIDLGHDGLRRRARAARPHTAALAGRALLVRVRCSARLETSCRIVTSVRLPGGGAASAAATITAGGGRVLRLSLNPATVAGLRRAPGTVSLRLRQRVEANGLRATVVGPLQLDV
jgi:uncharacterized delta-60 repeat protein